MTTHALVQRLKQQQEWLDQSSAGTGAGLSDDPFPASLNCAYSWMQLSFRALAAGQEPRALKCWFQASLCLPSEWDPQALAVIGLNDVQALRARSEDMVQRRARHLKDALAPYREQHGPASVFRIDRALSGYLGQARVFSSHPTQQPKLIYVPGLSTSGFIDPSTMPLAQDLQAAHQAILEEFEAALAGHDPLEPFMGRLSKDVERQYVSGGAQASWDAIFFDRHGLRHDETHRRYPKTSAVLDSADRCRIPRQSPETCFSILQPRTRIEPHYGVTNARLVVHLPLRVPQGCYLELVGVGRHHWREGEVFAFDDTFFHAAENPSDDVRGILLTDAWHPELSHVEREAFTALIVRITELETSPERQIPS